MEEKVMVSDTLFGVNANLKAFGDMIPQTDNKQLKQTLKQIRNQCEMSQEEIYEIARSKQYYIPAAKANPTDIQHVKSIFSQSSAQ